MAVKWAVANGNWNAGATWNDGVVPAADDDVYLNGHTINVTSSFSIGNGTISNELNPNTQLSGGNLAISTNVSPTIVANFSSKTYALLFNVSAYNAITIVGNVESTYAFMQIGSNSSVNLYVTGNISTKYGTFVTKSTGSGSFNCNFNVTGNITIDNGDLMSQNFTGNRSLTVAGNCFLQNGKVLPIGYSLNSFTLIGSLLNNYGLNILAEDATITGNISYASATGGMGIFANSLTINNPDTFTWKDITEPRSNPFIILTDAEMNNRQQYPSEGVVKQGVEYVWGEKIGTYQAPPESVVLKDYVYDNDEKVGTLENEVIVDNTNTINVYPYKRRNN